MNTKKNIIVEEHTSQKNNLSLTLVVAKFML